MYKTGVAMSGKGPRTAMIVTSQSSADMMMKSRHPAPHLIVVDVTGVALVSKPCTALAAV